MGLLSLLAFPPCSQVSAWLVEEQQVVVVLQQVDHHLDQLLQGHVDQRTGDRDLGLRGRTFDQGLVFLAAAL